MISQQRNIPCQSCVRFMGVVTALVSVLGLGQYASGQLTVERLLSSAIENPVASEFVEIADAIAAFQQNDFQGARNLLVATAESNLNLPPGDVMMAQLYGSINQINAMRSSLENAVKTYADDPEAYVIFADLARNQTRFTEAGLAYDKAIELCDKYSKNAFRKNSLQSRAYGGAAIVAEARENWSAAKNRLTAWAELAPNAAVPHLRLGKVHYKLLKGSKQGQSNAYAAYRKAYELDNQVTRPEINMARLYDQDGKRSNSRQLLAKAVERGADDLKVQLEAGQMYVSIGAIPEAKQCADAARQIDDNSLDAMLLQGLLGRYENDYTTSEAAFRAAHALAPNNVTVVLQLALSLVEQPGDQRKQAQALEWARLATRGNMDIKQSQVRESLVTLGWVLDRLGRTNEAGQAIQRAVSGGRLGTETTYFAAKILNDAGRSEVARQLLQQLVDSKTPFPYRTDAEELLNRI